MSLDHVVIDCLVENDFYIWKYIIKVDEIMMDEYMIFFRRDGLRLNDISRFEHFSPSRLKNSYVNDENTHINTRLGF